METTGAASVSCRVKPLECSSIPPSQERACEIEPLSHRRAHGTGNGKKVAGNDENTDDTSINMYYLIS